MLYKNVITFFFFLPFTVNCILGLVYTFDCRQHNLPVTLRNYFRNSEYRFNPFVVLVGSEYSTLTI